MEMSVATVVAGFLLSTGATMYSSWYSRQYMDVTQTRMTEIQTAINNYLAKNGHLPCVADPTNPQSGAETSCSMGGRYL